MGHTNGIINRVITGRPRIAPGVRGYEPTNHMEPKVAERSSRAVHFAVAAASEAIASARLDISREQPEGVGVISSSMPEHQYIGEHTSVHFKG